MFGKDNKKKELIKNLQEIYTRIEKLYQVSPGDLPPILHMKEVLAHHDFTKFNLLKPKLIENVDKMMANDIANLMRMLPNEDNANSDITVTGARNPWVSRWLHSMFAVRRRPWRLKRFKLRMPYVITQTVIVLTRRL